MKAVPKGPQNLHSPTHHHHDIGASLHVLGKSILGARLLVPEETDDGTRCALAALAASRTIWTPYGRKAWALQSWEAFCEPYHGEALRDHGVRGVDVDGLDDSVRKARAGATALGDAGEPWKKELIDSKVTRSGASVAKKGSDDVEA